MRSLRPVSSPASRFCFALRSSSSSSISSTKSSDVTSRRPARPAFRRRYQAALRVELHPEGEAQTAQDFLDLIQRFAPEILGAKHFRFGLLHQVADGLDIRVLEAVVGTHAQLEFFDATG